MVCAFRLWYSNSYYGRSPEAEETASCCHEGRLSGRSRAV